MEKSSAYWQGYERGWEKIGVSKEKALLAILNQAKQWRASPLLNDPSAYIRYLQELRPRTLAKAMEGMPSSRPLSDISSHIRYTMR
jgi:hypothetical protein